MNKKRIGIVHYTYPPIIGGVEKVVYDHAQLFAKYGFDITVFAGMGNNNNPKVKFKLIKEFRSLRLIDFSLYEEIIDSENFPNKYYENSEKIYKKLETNFRNIDVIIVHNVLTMTLNLCLNFALIKYIKNHPEKKYISWTHDLTLSPERIKKDFKNKEISKMVYEIIENVEYVSISNYLKEVLCKKVGFSPKNIKVISNGLNFDSFLNLHPITHKIIDKYHLTDFDYNLLYSGKIIKYKNIDICINIIHELIKQGKNPVLIITAKGLPHSNNDNYVDEIKTMIRHLNLEKNVVFIEDEIVNKSKGDSFEVVKDFYRLADIVINLSSFENFGLPLIEAGINKTPLIVNDLNVFKEIDSANIYFVDIDNELPEQIASKIRLIIESNQQLGFFRNIKKNFNLEKIFVEKIIPLVEK